MSELNEKRFFLLKRQILRLNWINYEQNYGTVCL